MSTQKTSKDVWDILQEATDKGWEDPGFTELLEITKNRALQYLRQLEDKQIAIKRQAEKGDQ